MSQSSTKKKASLEAKKAFVERSRAANYAASLELEGLKPVKRTGAKVSKEEVIAKHRAKSVA